MQNFLVMTGVSMQLYALSGWSSASPAQPLTAPKTTAATTAIAALLIIRPQGP